MNSVLVTGAARGIGKAICLRMAERGWRVYAGVRKLSDGDELTALNAAITPVLLDVTDADHIAALDAVLPADLTAVVNNAGVAVLGPVECLDVDAVRAGFEINVFGALAVTQAVLPRLRANRGRVVFISSLSGRISTPGSGAYNFSKFALEGLADALRVELRPWNIPVTLIEPGPIATDMWGEVLNEMDAATASFTQEHRDLYAPQLAAARKVAATVQQRVAAPVDTVVAEVEKALTTRNPKARIVVGLLNKVQALSTRFTPTPVLDAIFAAAAGVRRK
ncbi:SDR family oxidoreductase [Nocardia crassostreae]|uniref:SDR family oxidoreductase n=1 Tax=Nocardia crassostreae TaxID=53428 RepID=UPI00082E73EF|nr:SDR family oxidoreductase [Nocardia crassostreae]